VIGRVLARGRRPGGLLYYLYGPGKDGGHVRPHLVAGWRHPAWLEPPRRPDGRRDFRYLTGLLTQPVALLGGRAPDQPVWHCAVRAAPADPDLGDGAWMRIAAEIMHRTGLSRHGEEGQGVRWVAVHHGASHIHIVATLARQDGRRAGLHNEYYRIGEALRDIEAEYGLVAVARADRTAARRPSRAESEQAARAGQAEPPRVTLRRHVQAAAAAAGTEAEFFAGLEQRGVRVRLRHSQRDPDQVTGYAVTMDGAVTAAGDPVWFGGGKLAPDLTLPKLRARWDPDRAGPGPQPGPGRAARTRPGITRPAPRPGIRRPAPRPVPAAGSGPGRGPGRTPPTSPGPRPTCCGPPRPCSAARPCGGPRTPTTGPPAPPGAACPRRRRPGASCGPPPGSWPRPGTRAGAGRWRTSRSSSSWPR
jgi:hypothetical protein